MKSDIILHVRKAFGSNMQDIFNDLISVGRLLATPDIWTGRPFQIYAHLRMAGGGGGLA